MMRGNSMKRAVSFSLLAAVFAVSVVAQNVTKAVGPAKSSQALIALENKWVTALTRAEIATLDSILAENYVDTDEHSQRSNKADLLSVLKAGDLKMESIALSDLQVHDYGDAAVVIGSSAQVGNFKGSPLAAKILFTDTFIRRNGKWIVVASHRSAI